MKRCELCRKRRKRVLRVRLLGIEDCDACRRCAMEHCNVTPEQWLRVEKKLSIANGKDECLP